MNSVHFIGATGLRAQQAAVDAVANNVANINTAAFKRNAVAFTEMVANGLAPVAEIAGARVPVETLQGVAVAASRRSFEPGELRKTDDPTNIAIRGAGFMEVLAPGGQTLLWRGPAIQVNSDGFLAASNGMQLKAGISVPRDATGIQIAANGTVTAVMSGSGRAEQLGQIELVNVGNTNALVAVGDGMYRLDDPMADVTRGLPGEESLGLLAQGFSEAANVNLVDEMVGMMLMQRAYAANARVIQVADEMMDTVNQLRR